MCVRLELVDLVEEETAIVVALEDTPLSNFLFGRIL